MIDARVVVIVIALFIAAYVLLWCFVRPVKFFVKLAAKSVVGFFAILACNQLLAPIGFSIGLNAVTTLICGLLGVNGFLLLAAIQYFI